MKKTELTAKTETVRSHTKSALQALFDVLPPGQQKTVVKKKEVKELFDHYGVVC